MRLGISNLAWDPPLDEEVASLLRSNAVGFIDIAPAKYFDLNKSPDSTEIARVRGFWEKRGLRIWGMQALMFGSTLNLFGSSSDQEKMLERLERVCLIGREIGASQLVFGSPKNRVSAGLPAGEILVRARDFFNRLGSTAEDYGVTISLEPNPPVYGADFLVSSLETAHFVSALDHPAIKMQFDTGALILVGENPLDLLTTARSIVGHIHLSSPHLAPLDKSDMDWTSFFEAVRSMGSKFVPTIEMLTSGPETAIHEIERAVIFAAKGLRLDDERQFLT
jgi:sugar phosphate isomerase/epimerase